MPDHRSGETSPYLLQCADNPRGLVSLEPSGIVSSNCSLFAYQVTERAARPRLATEGKNDVYQIPFVHQSRYIYLS